MTLKDKAVSATLWSGAETFLRQALQFAIAIILARLLTPEEFGTIALLYLFIGLASAFVDCGFASALIQRQDVTHTDESTVFWFNLAMGSIMAIGLWTFSPWIASFFGLPILIPLTRILAINVFISALGSIKGTLLTKRLDFKTQMKISASATLLSGLIAIWMAWRGFGVWALAWQTLTATLITTSLLWFLNSWRPSWIFSFDSTRRFFKFGSYLLFSSLLDIAYNRIYTLLIGKYFGVRDLGFYNRADSTKQFPVGLLTGVLSRVAFPIFSNAANDKKQLKRGVSQALRGIMLINVPVMLGLMATTKQVVFTLFGERWLPAVPIMQVLCLGGVLWPLHVINLNALMAQGYSNLFFRLEVVKKIIGTALIVVGALYGVMGIAWSQVVFGVMAFLINAHYSRRYLDYGAASQTMDFLPSLFISTIMACVVYMIGAILVWSMPLALLLKVSVGVSLYFVTCWLFRVQAFKEVLSIVGERWTMLGLSKK